MENNADDVQNLNRKIAEWLQAEGYPTEYKTANIFRKHQFSVMQGGYVESAKDTKRELDVVASMAIQDEGGSGIFLRASYIIECKWSKSKPWVVFTSPSTRVAPSACVAQSIGSLFGESIIWTIAGDPVLHQMGLFSTPSQAGFGGRQALSSGQDHFYSALKSVVENSYAHAHELGKRRLDPGKVPRFAEVIFPIVVVDGRLFKASFDEDINDMQLDEASYIRCHWKGAVSAVAHATVDIVTLDGLDNFVEKRATETRNLLARMMPVARQIAKCAEQKSLDGLTVTEGPRGTVGLPKLLRVIVSSGKPTPADESQ
jgi:hypothetical protein